MSIAKEAKLEFRNLEKANKILLHLCYVARVKLRNEMKVTCVTII